MIDKSKASGDYDVGNIKETSIKYLFPLRGSSHSQAPS